MYSSKQKHTIIDVINKELRAYCSCTERKNILWKHVQDL